MQWIFLVTNICKTDKCYDYCLAVSLSGWQSIYLFIHSQQTTQELTNKIFVIFLHEARKVMESFCQKEDFKGTGSSNFMILAWAQKGTSDEKEKNSDAPQMIHIYQQSGFPRNYPARSFRFFIKSKDHKWWKVLKSVR